MLLLVIGGLNVKCGAEVICVSGLWLLARGYDVQLRDTIASYCFWLKKLLLVKFYFAVVERFDDSERLYSYAALSEKFASVLKCFLNDESHAFECGSCLLAEVDDTLGSVAVGEKVVNEKYVVVGGELVAADDYVILALLGE